MTETIEITRLDVLLEARKLAEQIGAVEHGSRFFETGNGARRGVDTSAVRVGGVKPDELCGVCIAGACILAGTILGENGTPEYEWCVRCEGPARKVLGDEVDEYDGQELTRAITDKGTPYVLAVLDQMIMDEKEAAA